ncbi:MAG: transglycosylase domain-containing protein [Candidatus Peribacteraceae bacterium]|nr:transglycosylase domain-containing protein [Candidatus Peribacteraceae bacterium]MDD5740184.1 transglycosylase domain-containing protein [Candidatus Peribacteraceae bacterium]
MASLSPPAGSMHRKMPGRNIFRHSLLANFLILGSILMMQLFGVWRALSAIGVGDLLLPQTVVLTDTNGTELRRVYLEKDRLELNDDDFSPFLKQAVIAIEDERFFNRSCIDLRAIARAAVADMTEAKAQGASTITQQLVGNLLLDRKDKSYARKLVELLLACRLELGVPRERILTLYLNHMAFGGTMYGAEEASRTYFGVSAGELTLAQSAVLAALLQRPTYFSPYGIHLHTAISRESARAIREGRISRAEDLPADAVSIGLLGMHFLTATGSVYVEGRTDLVLRAMRESGFISDTELAFTRQELKTMRFLERQSALAMPYFALYVQQQLSEGIPQTDRPCDVQAGGCIVKTTLDPQFQVLAERIVLEHAEEIRTKYGARNMALVAADRATGHILAYVGNVGYSDDEPGTMIDMARVPRQPGSSFKPFVYATAFEAGLNPDTFLLDGPLTLGGDHPRNYEGGYRDWTSISHALAASRNIPAILALLFSGGEDPVLATAARAGIVTPLSMRDHQRQSDPQYSFGYPLAIGAAEVPLFEMVQGYLTLANAGRLRPLTAIESIRTVDGQPLQSSRHGGGTQAIEPLAARWLTSILSDTSLRPTAAWNKALTVPGIQTAIKTGTSNRCIGFNPATERCYDLPGDVWTVGYTPEFVLGIWVGNADYSPLAPTADGMNVAAPLWKEFIAEAHRLRPEGAVRFPPELIAKKRGD